MIEPRIPAGDVITEPGFYRLPAVAYHADPAPIPSLSSSVADAIVNQSCEHGKEKHVRLTKQPPQKPVPIRDWGSAVHRIVLGVGPNISVVYADNWQTKEPQQARKAAYAAGEIPMLADDMEEIEQRAAPRLRAALESLLGKAIVPVEFHPELAMFWREGKQWGRTMIDAASTNLCRIVDIKTSGMVMRPDENLDRHISNESMDFQHAFIAKGLDKLDPDGIGRRKHFNLFQEQSRPYAVSCKEITEGALHICGRQVRAAFNYWNRCMLSGEWPGYVESPVPYEMPGWKSAAWMKRENFDRSIDIDELGDDD